jgi:hypothetical protein
MPEWMLVDPLNDVGQFVGLLFVLRIESVLDVAEQSGFEFWVRVLLTSTVDCQSSNASILILWDIFGLVLA